MSEAMPRTNHSRHAILSEIEPFDRETGSLKIVVETPKGSRNKYKYEPENDCLELTTALPEGMVFPYDFGFIPSTLGADGDPLDVLVLMDAPVVPGCVIRARLLGVIKARQRDKKDKDWVRNDRLIAVACHAQTHQDEKSIKDLRPHLTEEISAFFVDYNRLRDREFEQLDLCGPKKAMKVVEDGMKLFKTRHHKNGDRRKAA
jgi:inorganic pyrophosphatase